MTVPFSLDVANLVPNAFNYKYEIGETCASIQYAFPKS
jgi:hypothetical protein